MEPITLKPITKFDLLKSCLNGQVADFLHHNTFYAANQVDSIRYNLCASMANVRLFFTSYPLLIVPQHAYFDFDGVFIMLWIRGPLKSFVCISDEPGYSCGARLNGKSLDMDSRMFTEPLPDSLQEFCINKE